MSASERPSREELEREIERLQQENARLKQKIERLEKQLEEALRAAKRQAAPHSRGEPQPNPKPPGRKPGAEYGRHACRPVPRRVDEQIAVPVPEQCQHCGGTVAFQRTEAQYQEEIVRRTLVRRLDRKSTRLNSSHLVISYAVFCLKKKKTRCSDYLH